MLFRSLPFKNKGQDRGRGLEMQTSRSKINKIQGYVVQHWEYSQYFIIILNGRYAITILNHYVIYLKLI